MADNAPAKSIIEGTVKFRDGKKWKSRWCVMRKLSPVADCVHLQLYKDLKERQKNGQTKASLSLQQYLGFESGFTLDKESNTLAVLCEDVTPILAFDTRETLMHWRVKFQHNLGSSKEFAAVLITAPSTSKINAGPVRIHVCGSKLALCGSRPPEVLTLWDVKLLRRYGIVEKRFCLEGGTRCGRGEGLFVFAAERGRELVELLDLSRDSQRMSVGSRCSSVLDKRFSDSTSCFDDSFLRSSSPSWMPTSQTMHCLDLDQSFDENQFFRRPTSLPRCTSCVGKIGSQLTRSSTMSTTPGPMSPIWTMENIMEKRSESDRASMYSQSSGSDYSVPRSVMDKSFESKRLSPIGCCTPTIPVKVGIGCQCWQHKTCCCRKKFSGPFENYDVPKTPMPLIQEHPADISLESSSLYDTPKKLKCILNGSSCECQHAKVNDSKVDDDDANVPDVNIQENNETHSNYVNITPVEVTKKKVLNNYANLDLNATLEKFETSLQILRSAGFSQEDLDALEDIPEHDDRNSIPNPTTECCNDHINYLHMGPLDSNSSSKHSDEVSRISHSSDPNHTDTDNTISSKRSSSADFTKKEEDLISNKSMCFTPTVLRKSKPGYSTLPLRIESGSIEKSFKIPESKTEISLVARLRESVRIRRSSSVPSKSDKNRDSSSSNDSGVSTGSLKHHKCDFNEFEICVNNSKNQKSKCNKNRKSVTPELTTFMKSSDPMKTLTFQFEEVSELAKMNGCNDTLTRRKKKLETDNAVRHSQMTNKSTSSGASDTSDYMESLSVSSFSSCDVHSDRHVTRPRSGKEYASIDRTAI